MRASMTGRVIARPERKHECAPGWTYGPVSDGTSKPGELLHLDAGERVAHPPSGYDYPEGTVWQCECGRTWVSTGPPAPNRPGMTDFRPESRRKRRRRERAACVP